MVLGSVNYLKGLGVQGRLTGEPRHFAVEEDLSLDVAVLDGVFVKVLEDDGAASYGFGGRWLRGGSGKGF